MKNIMKYIAILLVTAIVFTSCKKNNGDHKHDTEENIKNEDVHEEHKEKLLLTKTQMELLKIKVAKVSKRNMSGFIEVNGLLKVPPQNEATVTTALGANISSITVIEGDKIKKGQILAYITHPDIITLQTDYLQTYNKLTFLEQNYNRQKKLYEAEVGSGKDYQEAKSAYSSTKGLVKGLESQLQLIGLSTLNIQKGDIQNKAPIKSPIDGYIEKVTIKTGQYVLPQTGLFEVVNIEHVHADLMVFEKDMSKVKNGQKVIFNVEALKGEELTAKIFSIGKSFEEGPKALHIHAEIEHKNQNLIPGTYVKAKIITDEKLDDAISNEGVFKEGEISYVFVAKKAENSSWEFVPKEILIKITSDGYTSFSFKDDVDTSVLIAQNGAYYLMAEMKKSEAEHSH